MATTPTYRNALTMGTMLLEYRLESVLGVGGFGMTYLCTDTNLDKRVAIKEYFPSDLALREPNGGVVAINTQADDGYKWGLDRFIQEARTLAKFSHPHIVRVNRYFEANATGYMVMDYENGESFNQILKDQPAPSEARLKDIIFPLLDGLHAVHETGFLHRDIKPANIFIRTNQSPVLLDFGAARQAVSGATKSLTAVLTPGYAPLEQYSGQGNQGPWTDIYAMAGVLYRAYTSENPPDAVSRLKNDSVPAKLAQLKGRVSEPALHAMQWALSLDEKQRPATVEIWKRALEGKTPSPASSRVVTASIVDQNTPTRVAGSGTDPTGTSLPASTSAASPATQVRRASTRQTYEEEEPPSPWRWVGIGAVVLAVMFGGRAWFTSQRDAKLAKEDAARVEAAKLAALQQPVDTRSVEERAAQILEGSSADRDAAAKRAADRDEMLRKLDEDRNKGSPGTAAAVAPATAPVATGSAPAAAEVRKPLPVAAAPQPVREEAPPPSANPFEQKVMQDFRQMDANADGFLTIDEVRGRGPIERDFARLDANGDGRLSMQEFMGVLAFKPGPDATAGSASGPAFSGGSGGASGPVSSAPFGASPGASSGPSSNPVPGSPSGPLSGPRPPMGKK